MNAATLRFASDEDILSDFLSFVDSKSAKETYNFYSPSNCAFAQYLKSKDVISSSVRINHFTVAHRTLDTTYMDVYTRELPKLLQEGNILFDWKSLSYIAALFNRYDRHTFGGLSKRLHKVLDPKPVRPSISDWVHGVVSALLPSPAPETVSVRIRG